MRSSIRLGVFETNSSSIHGVCITDSDIYSKFLDGKLIVSSDISDEKLEKLELSRAEAYDPDDIIERIKNEPEFRELLGIDRYYEMNMSYLKCTMKELMFYHGLWTLEGLKDSDYAYRIDETNSPDGDNIVVIGYYGRD